jgi:hypothetical protein
MDQDREDPGKQEPVTPEGAQNFKNLTFLTTPIHF